MKHFLPKFIYLVFSLHVFNWSGRNDYFFRGSSDGIVIGASNGKFGIFVDGDLNRYTLIRIFFKNVGL